MKDSFCQICDESEQETGMLFLFVSDKVHISTTHLKPFNMHPWEITFEGTILDMLNRRDLMNRINLWAPQDNNTFTKLEVFAGYIMAFKACANQKGDYNKQREYLNSNPTILVYELKQQTTKHG